MPLSKDDLHDQVDMAHKYHRPKYQETMEAMGEIREAFLITGHTIINNCPISRELSLALTELDNACMHAIAALARHEPIGQSSNVTSHPLPESETVTETGESEDVNPNKLFPSY